MAVAERLAPPLQCLAVQQLSSGEVALGVQQRAEVADGGECVRVSITEGPANHLQRLTVQRLSLVIWICARSAWSRALRSSMLRASRQLSMHRPQR